ncbi:hypothetical protein FDENT_8466 [Fusarium denticulatum]|uniref:Uncharacterized protein n=1 Tax=Fusarium denticulatum TaxID=48507 RepID=A0A8H5U3A6_9HYPO|nr:hypothetical protein FDENT_8466 [Fusarium denticulatum]
MFSSPFIQLSSTTPCHLAASKKRRSKALTAHPILHFEPALPPSCRLTSFKNSPVSSEVEQEFKSPALSLCFQLNRHFDILVPTPALEPIRPAGRARSGVVLDAIREFSRATIFTVYIEARNASPKLQSVSDAVSQGLFKTSCSSRFQLASMYAGLGAKIVQLGADGTLAPPSYEETEPPPPLPPIDPKPDRKRPRQDTVTERTEEIALIWAQLQMLKQAKDADGKRIAFL